MSDLDQHPFWRLVRGEVPAPPGAQTLGFSVLEAEPDSGRAVIEFEAKPEFTNGLGNVQGGFVAAMIDYTIGPAQATTFGVGELGVTLELKVSFVRPAKLGRLIGTGMVVHRGKSIVFAEAELRDAEDNLIATATSTSRVIRPDAEQLWIADQAQPAV